ncbi:hypothetical protein CYLTODRAFT_460592, partial [Cylindrobasidium torrendii FP15055 ss-10]
PVTPSRVKFEPFTPSRVKKEPLSPSDRRAKLDAARNAHKYRIKKEEPTSPKIPSPSSSNQDSPPSSSPTQYMSSSPPPQESPTSSEAGSPVSDSPMRRTFFRLGEVRPQYFYSPPADPLADIEERVERAHRHFNIDDSRPWGDDMSACANPPTRRRDT